MVCRSRLLIKDFTQVGELWQLAPDIRAMVKYQQVNLLSDFSRLGRFDVIFCRNVLIYFDDRTKRKRAQPVSPARSPPTASWCWAPPRRWRDSERRFKVVAGDAPDVASTEISRA